MTVEELAQAIVDIRVTNFKSLIKPTGPHGGNSQGISTEVRDRDIAYARALLTQVKKNRAKEATNA